MRRLTALGVRAALLQPYGRNGSRFCYLVIMAKMIEAPKAIASNATTPPSQITTLSTFFCDSAKRSSLLIECRSYRFRL
jgi:hypothetical protein